MGQYYQALVIDENGTAKVVYPWDYDNGLKLCEHSYIGNDFMNAVLSLIYDCPQVVVWIGDYSDIQKGDKYESRVEWDKFRAYYDKVWGDGHDKYRVSPPVHDVLNMHTKGMYLVNYTSHVYINIEKYIAKNKWVEGPERLSHFWCMHPLSLLTACGNGRGGGDYNDDPNVGTWAFDVIEYTNAFPLGYKEVEYCFPDRK